MSALATVRPPTPASEMPIGASLPAALIGMFSTVALVIGAFTPVDATGRGRASAADRRAIGRASWPVGLGHQEGREHAADGAEQVRLPRNGDHTGDVGRR